MYSILGGITMKKRQLTAILLIAALTLTLAACSGDNGPNTYNPAPDMTMDTGAQENRTAAPDDSQENRTTVPDDAVRSFVPLHQPTGAEGCKAPDFCMCEHCKSEPPTDLTWGQLNLVRDFVCAELRENYNFPFSGGSVSEWGELYHRVKLEFTRDDEEMLTLRPQIEAAVYEILANSSNPLAARVDLNAFAFIGAGAPVLIPVNPGDIPQAEPLSLSKAQEWADIMWRFESDGKLVHVGEITITRVRAFDVFGNNIGFEDLPAPVVAYVFESKNARGAFGKYCGRTFSYHDGEWNGVGAGANIQQHDYPDNFPRLVSSDVTSNGMTLSWQNDSDIEFIYGTEHRLFKRQGDYWRELNPGGMWHSIGFTLYPNSTRKLYNFSFEGLEPGEYRITKGFNSGSGVTLVKYEAEYFFEIK
jgi:predicted small lipoprotein YifL